MLNNRDDDKFEGQEDSEYHFSDDEVSYEVEPDATKPPPPEEPRRNPFKGMTHSRRMLFSLVIFLALVFVVYKMVTPTVTTPETEITQPAPIVATEEDNIQSSVNLRTPPAKQVMPAPSTAAPSNLPPPGSSVQAPAGTVANQSPMPLPGSVPVTTPGVGTRVSTAAMEQSQPAISPTPAGAQLLANNMPAVIPVQSAVPTYNQGASPSGMMGTTTNTSNLTAESERLMAQMHAAYLQKINEYSAQTKAIETEMQSLTARVTTMETQLNRLVQILTQKAQTQSANDTAHRPADIKINYNVQAIIPGRAWLRAANGETVTVAEGDVVKDLGRITKIDPYDGVVEINTGNKLVSLTYGNGG